MERKCLDLTLANYGNVRFHTYELAILPWGATEPHNYHLPYMTDCLLSHAVAVDVAQAVYEQYGWRCMVMPPVHYGSQNPGQRELPFCVHGRYETQKAILTDIVASLHAQGMRRLLIINGHGGNSFKNMIRDLAVDYPDFLIASSEWFTASARKEMFDIVGDHADEVETSVMMHYHPELVNLEEAGDGAFKEFAPLSLRKKVAWLPRNWQEISVDTGVGDPRKATAEKGQLFVQAVVQEYVQLVYDLVKSPLY